MFDKLVKWHQEWEAEGLAVLENPALADTVKPGIRRWLARGMAGLGPIERREVAAFSRKYLGWRAYAGIAKFVAPFILAGGLAHLVWPKISVGMGMLIGFFASIELLFTGIAVWFNYTRFSGANQLRWIAKYFAGVVGGCLLVLAVAVMGFEATITMAKLQEALPFLLGAIVGMTLFVAIPVLIVGNMRAREAQLLAQDMMRQAEQDQLERQLSEAQLRLLRAQIEPHFLFNTLGAVQQLAEQGAPRAAALTADLIAFLRATSSEMRREFNTLREEFQLTQAYLNVMQARMGSRFHYSIDLPEALADAKVPSMTVLTLAENAIKHGIEPALRGGTVDIAARSEAATLVVTVSDTGAGMAPVPGKGLGLENVRSRLALAYGGAAQLDLADGAAGGVTATMVLPGAAA